MEGIPSNKEQRTKEDERTHLLNKEDFSIEDSNNFYMYFMDSFTSRAWIDQAKQSGWFDRYLETYGEQYELLRERIQKTREEAITYAKGFGEEPSIEYYEKYDDYFFPAIESLKDELQEQYVGMYESITDEETFKINRNKGRILRK